MFDPITTNHLLVIVSNYKIKSIYITIKRLASPQKIMWSASNVR